MKSPLRSLRGLAIAPWIVLALTGCLGSPSDLEGEGELREPIERPADLGAADAACGTFPPDHFRYLDDTRCARRMPSDRSRTWSCPNTATSARTRPAGGTRDVTYTRDGRPSTVDLETLRPFVPSDVAMSVALIRRVDGEAHVRWLGTARHAEPIQPWSSTKWIAIVNAAARMRTLSGYRIGLDAAVSGIPLGDLATVVHQYDERRYSSNGLARWFLDIGGRSRANGLMRSWLGRPARETYGGNYGAPSAALPYSFSNGAATLDVTPDLGTGPANQLSTDALADALRRVVLHREVLPAERLPGLQWTDVQHLLYGAERSRWYGASTPGGMQADTAIYVQQALDLAALERRSLGQWRVFGKLGFGPSRGGEFVHVSYGCLPTLDDAGRAIPDRGQEFVIATQLPARGDHPGADARMAQIYRAVLGGMLDGRVR